MNNMLVGISYFDIEDNNVKYEELIPQSIQFGGKLQKRNKPYWFLIAYSRDKQEHLTIPMDNITEWKELNEKVES